MLHERWLEFSMKAVKERREDVWLVRKVVREWAESPEMMDFAKKARLRYLRSMLRSATAEFEQNREEAVDCIRNGLSKEIFVEKAEGLLKKIRGYQVSMDVLEGKLETYHIVTEEMVEEARNYDMASLVEVNAIGRCTCPFHDGIDKNATIKNNWFYCFVCGKHANSLDVYMKLHKCSFKEAVLALNGKMV
jgi:hypothetical protein